MLGTELEVMYETVAVPEDSLCPAVEVGCPDFHFRAAFADFYTNHLGYKVFPDGPLAHPGGAKVLATPSATRDLLVEEISKLWKLHKFSRVIAWAHTGCGGYEIPDLQEERRVQLQHLEKAQEFLEHEFPQLIPVMIIADRHKEPGKVLFLRV